MSPTYKNYASTTLSEGISDSSLTISVLNDSIFPNSNFNVQIGSEYIRVDSREGDTLTASVRGLNGSTASAHPSGDPIYYVANSDWLNRTILNIAKAEPIVRTIFGDSGVTANRDGTTYTISASGSSGNTVSYVNYENRPAAGTAGQLFFPASSGTTIGIDTGSDWVGFGPVNKFTPLTIGEDWTWVNQGSGTVESYGDVTVFNKPGYFSYSYSYFCKTLPSAPYTITTFIQPQIFNKNYISVGIGLRNSSDGKAMVFNLFGAGLNVAYMATPTSAPSVQSAAVGGVANSNGVFMRVQDTGSVRNWLYSVNGYIYEIFHSQTNTYLVTPNQFVFQMNPENLATPRFNSSMAVYHYEET